MKAQTHALLLTAFASIFVGSELNAETQPPVLVTAPVEKVFVPQGFDDNDDVEVVIHGHFANTCYKTGPVSATVDATTRVVTIDAKAYHYRGVGCAQMLVPFVQSVKLGPISQGAFEIVVKDRTDATASPLLIGEARSAGPDDFLYAPVADVSLDEGQNGQYSVTLRGEYPFTFVGCMVIREIRTYASPGNTLVVMPIAELIDGPECDDQRDSKKFAITKSVGPLAPEEHLVHVRVLEGNSLNRFVDLTK